MVRSMGRIRPKRGNPRLRALHRPREAHRDPRAGHPAAPAAASPPSSLQQAAGSMRRAVQALAQRAGALAALEAGAPSTSGCAAQVGRALATSAAARAPVHPQEEVYNRCVQLAIGSRWMAARRRGRRQRPAAGGRRRHCLAHPVLACPALPPAVMPAAIACDPDLGAGSGSSSTWGCGCPPRRPTPGWPPTRWWWATSTCTTGWAAGAALLLARPRPDHAEGWKKALRCQCCCCRCRLQSVARSPGATAPVAAHPPCLLPYADHCVVRRRAAGRPQHRDCGRLLVHRRPLRGHRRAVRGRQRRSWLQLCTSVGMPLLLVLVLALVPLQPPLLLPPRHAALPPAPSRAAGPPPPTMHPHPPAHPAAARCPPACRRPRPSGAA